MSYRNDHDAALGRIAALESELASLRRTQAPEAPKKPTTRREEPREKPREESGTDDGALLHIIGSAVGALLVIVVLMYRVTRADKVVVEDEAIVEPIVTLPVARDVTSDEACLIEIHERAARDARAADPRAVAPVSAMDLMSGPPPCGRKAPVLISAEQDNVASLITVYYENDPVTVDGYASAERLWFEYHRARAPLRR